MQPSKLASEISSKRTSGQVHVILFDRVAQRPIFEVAFENAKASFMSSNIKFEEFTDSLAAIKNKETAKGILETVLWKDLAYGAPTMQREEAKNFADAFFGVFDEDTKCFSNSTWEYDDDKKEVALSSWHSLTEATFDCGVFVVDNKRIGAIWVEDED